MGLGQIGKISFTGTWFTVLGKGVSRVAEGLMHVTVTIANPVCVLSKMEYTDEHQKMTNKMKI